MAFLEEVTSTMVARFPLSKRPKRRKQKRHGPLRLSLRSHIVTFLPYLIGQSSHQPILVQRRVWGTLSLDERL